ncbi:hypothetical protein ACM46_06265 [Chryseobacterium angstadtii]|uniref:Lipoprotein n=1 Tax=Chryseobacterium angstadtii TaxID=558151 RepID=A0A0J7L8X5_9FLAO|nr:hypothetical protein [Chryseobacterium angstadtii]KMQ65490.1 hypothetical protein ACM46_06265 [Chryseobacterium angstadtii]
MKCSFLLVLAVLPMMSCSGNDDPAVENIKPVEKEVYSLVYQNYSVQSISAYKGPAGQKTAPSESYLNSYWSTYQEPAWKKITLDLKNSTIQLISGTSADISYSIKVEKDSVFINENNSQSFIGIFSKNYSQFMLKRSFRYIKKMPRANTDALVISQKAVFGTTLYEDIFGKNIFNTPSEMTTTGDDVLWTNIDYHYKNL